MPLIFLPFTALVQQNTPFLDQSVPVLQQVPIDEVLTVRSEHWYKDLSTGKTVFEGKVSATYGMTVLTSERLVVDEVLGEMVAEGESRIDDPEGVVTAKHIIVNWKLQESRAENVRIESGYVLIQAESLETKSTPEPLWIVKEATVELTDLNSGGNRFTAREVEVRPGKTAIARHVFFQVFGQMLGPIPSQTFYLGSRVSGLRAPSLKFNDQGVGLSWRSSLPVSKNIYASGAWDTFPGDQPAFNFELTQSFLSEGSQLSRILPRSDLNERYADGWFNNIVQQDPVLAFDRLRDRKSSLTFGSVWNTSANARTVESNDITKAFDLAYEQGGPLGEGGWVSTARIQQIRDSANSGWVNRIVLDTTIMAPQHSLGGLKTHARLDLFGTSSSRGSFGIIRGEYGAFGEISPGLTLGGAYIWAEEGGKPDFAFDSLGFGSGFNLRLDYIRGPYAIRYLTKYDFHGREFYDHEWEFALAAGSLEPYISRREFPGDFRFGVRFRANQLSDRLMNRDSKKNRPAK